MSEKSSAGILSLQELLASVGDSPDGSLSQSVYRALHVARHLQARATVLQTPPEKRQQAELDRLLQNAEDKATLIQMTDQAFRTSRSRRAVDQFIHILDVQGVPRFFSALDRTLLKGFQSFGGFLPDVAAPLVKDHMQKETANVVLPADRKVLAGLLGKRQEQGIRMNVNILGEAILSEPEAERRLEQYLEVLQMGETEVVSVKISTLCSQISPLAREHTIHLLCDRLEMLYRTAANLQYQRRHAGPVPKFVYLDMEEYRDMSLTAEVFMRTLDRPGLESVRAGIVLQAYIPDSFLTQQTLNEWARKRTGAGGAPITLRLVKGANMEMERVEASLRGWPQAPYLSKVETDANFKRMTEEGMKPENLAAVHLGVASHNLFEMAYALVLASERQGLDKVQFEMLEGMANHQRRALVELEPNLLLYAPVCNKENFIHAIGYLIRRLDENTGPENFLRHAFKLEVGSPEWQRLEEGFLQSHHLMEEVSAMPRRTQDRRQAPEPPSPPAEGWRAFVNEPDTDFSLPHHSEWADSILQNWEPRYNRNALDIPLVINGREKSERDRRRDCLDPSRPGVVVGRYTQADQKDIQEALECAEKDPDEWRSRPAQERYDCLGRVAQEIRRARADLIGAALADGGKTIQESDPEVSEAVDFLEFYRETAWAMQTLPGLQVRPQGVVAVVPPWNFPIAIPCGGMAAALAAGNTVLLKPASDTVLTAWVLCQCFWDAGVPTTALQFVPCTGSREGQYLVHDPRVHSVILTGGTATAMTMLQRRPDLHLLAETGGKNATIVTGLSDRDQAIKHVLHSAFSHGGQKCSATSLLMLEAEVYDDPVFRRTLEEAVESIPVGSAWNLPTRMGPLIRPPSGELERGLKTLEPGESWLVMPHRDEHNPNLWFPGVKLGVRPGSFTHLTELFGPVLGLMRYERLEEAIGWVNQTGYGLTSGLESLDDREQDLWQNSIRAGNLYINRPTTGAIVLRQPFGGLGKSAFGPGIKAGGPHYVSQFMEMLEADIPPSETPAPVDPDKVDPALMELRDRLRHDSDLSQAAPPEDVQRLVRALDSYHRHYLEEFGREHDHFLLLGEDNLRRYRPIAHLRLRVEPADDFFEVFARACAARIAGCRITVSVAPAAEAPWADLLEKATESWAAGIEFLEENEDRLVMVIREKQTDRIRYAGRDRVGKAIWKAAAEQGLYLATAPVLAHGRMELLQYLEEQSLSNAYHRYGNLGSRSGEKRGRVL